MFASIVVLFVVTLLGTLFGNIIGAPQGTANTSWRELEAEMAWQRYGYDSVQSGLSSEGSVR